MYKELLNVTEKKTAPGATTGAVKELLNVTEKKTAPGATTGAVKQVVSQTEEKTNSQTEEKTNSTSGAITEGIDLSSWQGGYNPLTAAKQPGFVILKSSEGLVQDSNFNSFYNSSVGVIPVIGSFHYLRSGVDTNQQIKTALNANAGKAINFYAVDVEGQGNVIDQNFANQAVDYATKMKDITGKTTYIYTGQSLYDQYFKNSGIPLWLAAPSGVEKNFPGTPTIVQNAWNGKASDYGVTGSNVVDTDVYPGTLSQLKQSIATGDPAANTQESLASLPYQGLGGTLQSAPVASALGSVYTDSSTPSVAPSAETVPSQGHNTTSTGAGAGAGATNPLISVSLLPSNITGWLGSISTANLGTSIVFVALGFILVVIGLIMLFPGSGSHPAAQTTTQKLQKGVNKAHEQVSVAADAAEVLGSLASLL